MKTILTVILILSSSFAWAAERKAVMPYHPNAPQASQFKNPSLAVRDTRLAVRGIAKNKQ